jgi:hypothetical protein
MMQRILDRFPEELQDMVVKTLIDGSNLEALLESREGSAIAGGFVKTISQNVEMIIGLSLGTIETEKIYDKAKEIAWCIKQMKHIQSTIDQRKAYIEGSNDV